MLRQARKGSPIARTRVPDHANHWRAKRSARGVAVLVAAWIAVLLPATGASAAPGELDPRFGEDGIVTTRVGAEDDLANAVAVQDDGKTVIAGYSRRITGFDFMVARYERDGDLDETFGGDGIVETDIGDNDYGNDVAIQPDGRIVVVGSVDMGGSDIDIGVARYNPDGTLDGTFGGDGLVTTDYGLSNTGNGVALQADGKILAVGYAWNGANYDFTITRYESDGDLDTTFDGDGKVLASVGSNDDYGTTLAIQPDGKILAAGCSCDPGDGNFGVVRLETNGALDASFDTDGRVTTDVNGIGDFAQAIALQEDGRIVVGGANPGESATDFALARYTTAGALDTSFDADGKVTTQFGTGGDWLSDLAIQHDGRIAAAGWTHNGSNEDVALARFNTNGSLDTRFSADGKTAAAIGSGDDRANGVALLDDGRVVVAGSTETAEGLDVAVARYGGLAEGDLDPTFGKSGWVSTPLGLGDDHARGVAVQPDGKVVVAGYSMIGGIDDFVVARFEADGDLDTSFGGTGWVPTNFAGGPDLGWSVALQDDGRIVVAGYAHTGADYDFAVARYLSDGTPDPSFGASGRVTTAFAGGNDIARAVAVQPDGKIVVAGYTYSGIDNDFALARYNPDGSLDTSFDTDGMATASIMGDDQAWSVALQDDGDILTAGQTYNGSNYDFALMRWLTNGSPDPSFGTSGRVWTPIMIGDYGRTVLVQPDDKIVVAGYSNSGADDDFAAARYSSLGVLDGTFGGGGKVIAGMEAGSLDQATGAILQPDGKIVLAGRGWTTGDFALMRLGTNGSLDPTFDGDGRVRTPIGTGADTGYAIARSDDGSLVVAGDTWNGSNYDIGVVRYAGDQSAPSTGIDTGPTGAVAVADATFTFSSDDTNATFRCSLDGAAYATCVSPRSFTGLAEGSHTFRVRAVDAAGNTDASPAMRTWSIDTTVPATTLTSGPTGAVTSADATFTFDSDEGSASFECRLDSGAFATCTSPKSYVGLSQASHTFEVRAIDAASNTDATPATRTWSIDTTPPTTTLTAGPSGTVADTDALLHTTSDVPATAAPTYATKWGTIGGAEGLFQNPNGVAVSDSGLVFVADTNNNRIQVFDSSGTFIRTWGRDVAIGGSTGFEVCTASCKNGVPGGLNGELNMPSGVALDASGNVLVADTGNHRIQVFAPDGTYLSKWGSPGGANGQFNSPFALTVAPSGQAYVADTGNSRVQRFTGAGAYVGQWATASPPYGIDADASGNLYVACYSTSLVQEFTGAGGFIRQWAVAGNPVGVAVDGSGNVNVARYTTHQLSRYGPTGTHLATWGTPGGGNGQVVFPAGIAVDASDNVYVAEVGNDRVQRFSPVGVSFECSLDDATFGACSMPLALTGLADGSHNVRIRAVDAAGNADATPASRTWTVDTAAPDTSIDSGPDALGNSSDAVFAFGSDETGAAFECNLDSGGYSACTSPKAYTGLSEGAHDLRVRATDTAGNTDATAAIHEWVVDMTPPSTSLDSGPSGPVAATGVSFSFSSDANNGMIAFRSDRDGNDEIYTMNSNGSNQTNRTNLPVFNDNQPTWSPDGRKIAYGSDKDGLHEIYTMNANGSGAAMIFDHPFQNWDASWSPDGNRIAFTSNRPDNNIFVMDADGANEIQLTSAVGSNGEATWSPDASKIAYHGPGIDLDIFVKNSDGSGGESALTNTAGNDVHPSWSPDGTRILFSSTRDGDEEIFVMNADGSGETQLTFNSVGDIHPSWSPDGSRVAFVSYRDGNAEIYVMNPDGSSPTRLTTNSAADLDPVWQPPTASFRCSLDGAPFTACVSWKTYAGLSQGVHTFDVKAVDFVGNIDDTPAHRQWTVDTVAPDTFIMGGPSGATTSSSAAFNFASPDTSATFECSLDSGSWAACGSPFGYVGLPDGGHTFEVRAVDAAGNTDASPMSRAWSIDTVAPNTSIVSGPSGVVGSPDPTFTFTSADAVAYECSLDDGAWASCATPQGYLGLADGIHTFRVRAMDMAGNLDPTPAARTWTIDTGAPNTSIDSGPSGTTGSAAADFAFGANEAASFECDLDGGGYAACSSPEALASLPEGEHTYSVRATDAAGNTDPTPATRTWTVDLTPPDTTIDTGPEATTTQTDASFEFSSADVSATFKCELDDGGWSTCTSPSSHTGLSVGVHVFRVKALDAGGNDDPTADSWMWTIVPPAHQPDGKVKISSSATYLGDQIYNATGSGQIATKKMLPGKKAVFTFRVQNDGNVDDSYAVKGCGTSAALGASYSDGGGSVTPAVVAGTYATALLTPGGEVDVTVTLKAGKRAKSGKTYSCLLTARSAAGPTKTDSVKAAITIK